MSLTLGGRPSGDREQSMIRRPNRREEHTTTRGSIARATEVKKLRRRVAQLEAALARATDKDAESLIDVLPAQPNASAGFAAAWTEEETTPEALDAFFSAGHPDLRARRWLLTTK